jgi:hypothetical protein
VESARSPGRQPPHQFDPGHPAQDRQDRLGLSDDAESTRSTTTASTSWCRPSSSSNGAPRKVVTQTNRNGFLYVIDRATGKLLAANKSAKVTWADKIDMETGRPVWSQVTRDAFEGKNVQVWQHLTGGKN